MSLWNFGTGDGAHALVIGVGDYPALPGGSGPLFPHHGGMGQLTSATHSALAFANWLTTTYTSSTAPLRSLELLLSDATPMQFTAGGQTQTVERATFPNLQQKILAWFQRADADKNRTIFYFCGHGMSAGFQCTLLLEDFGTVIPAPLLAALDFTVFHQGMDQCRAREQVFIIDACRVASPMLLTAQTYGNPVLMPGKPTTPPRKAPVFYAALPGVAAYGRTNQPSFFTDALVQGLNGSGAAKSKNRWFIQPTVLLRSVSRRLENAIANTGVTQACTGDQIQDFNIHDLPGVPDIPVTVSCNPPVNTASDKLIAAGATGNREQAPPLPNPWVVDLPAGIYSFSAGAATPKQETVHPPYADVDLP